MTIERSYGIIPLRFEGEWEVFMVQLHAGHWGFPKGHGEPEEEPLQTATRELQEETSLKVKKVLKSAPIVEHYTFDREGISCAKEVTYYLAEVEGSPFTQQAEIAASGWFSLDSAGERATFPEAKAVVSQVIKLLSELK